MVITDATACVKAELNGIMQSIDPSIPFYDVEMLEERRRDEEAEGLFRTS
jgi:hypothetical protein